MKITINWKVLGGSLMASAPLLQQYGQKTWWVAFVFLMAGPVLMAIENKPKE